ncbi:MAG: hypothetical protein K9J17_15075 [Flavobacteriales bacterium]|nr:hypothetical protein [Flavobacteriales bacterium]
MNNRTFYPLALILIVGAVFSSGCKKFVHQNIQAASNSSVAIVVYNDVFEQLNLAANGGTALDQMTVATWNLSGSLCATATLEPLGSVFPKTLTLDYGTDCVGPNGTSRGGMIVAVFSGNYGDQGTTIDVSFDNFNKGQYTLAGTYAVTCDAANGAGNPVFSEVIADGAISWGTQQVLWNANLNRTWTAGFATNYNTPDTTSTMGMAGVNDDVYELTGTATGNDSNTHPFTWETSTALVLQTGCMYINQGTLVISPANFNDGTVDYGTGECDKQATIEVDGEVFNFTL